MADEWRYVPAEEFCASVRDGTHDSPKPVDHGRFLVTSRHIIGGRLDLANAYLISQDEFDAINKRSKVEQWDVLVSMIGTVGGPCLIKQVPDFAIKNIGLFKSKGEIEGKWLYYYLRSPEAQQLVREQSRGTTQQYIPLGALRAFPIRVPDDYGKMQAIAHILGTLDDKIELNRRMNETLEAMARAIFKSWFVDFDPVRAKVDGQKPVGVDEETAAVFPGSFERHNGELVPAHWGTCVLYDTAEFINGAAFRSQHFCGPSEGLAVVKIAELKNGITGQTKFSNRTDLDSKYNIDTGALLYSWSGSPDTSLDVFLWTLGPGLLNQHIFKIETDSSARKHFVFYLLKYLRPTLIEIARNKQTTGLGHVTVADMRRLEVFYPPDDVLRAFDGQVGPLFDKCFLNSLESQTLAALRDTLLPKLLSGEIRVADATGVVEAAT